VTLLLLLLPSHCTITTHYRGRPSLSAYEDEHDAYGDLGAATLPADFDADITLEEEEQQQLELEQQQELPDAGYDYDVGGGEFEPPAGEGEAVRMSFGYVLVTVH
jgi:hypothetical protein